jgi:hypothetical protein
MLFSERSVWAMLHGIVLGGAPALGLAAALVLLYATPGGRDHAADDTRQSRVLAGLLMFSSVTLWLAVLVGTYVVFPPYRATPPADVVDLSRYPRSLLQSRPDTAWLHAFAMEIKEHMPWIAAMLSTAAGFVAVRYRTSLLSDRQLRAVTAMCIVICFAVVSFVALMGIFVNKVAPLE